VAGLEPSQARLEQARALIDLGACCAAPTGAPTHESLRRGLQLAYRAGAAGLVKHAQDELAATGAPGRARWR